MTPPPNDLFREMCGWLDAAMAARPDINREDLVAGSDGTATTFDEINASGEPMVFVCARTSDGPSQIKGSVEKFCAECTRAVWMSPATVASFERLTRAQILCMQCTVESAALANSNGKKETPSKG